VLPQIFPFSFGEESANAGDVIAVQCTVTKGNSPIVISWLFNNTKIKPIDGILILKIGSRISSLSIDSVRSEHSGIYTCVARNAAGLSNHTSHLQVNDIIPLILYIL
jgi:hypothetical protein